MRFKFASLIFEIYKLENAGKSISKYFKEIENLIFY